MRIAYFDCPSGASGDMVLGALVDAGVELGALEAALATLKVDGWRLEAREVERGGLRGTHLSVRTDPARRFHALGDMLGPIERSTLPDAVKRRSEAVLRRLAEAEARVHRVPVDAVHFHEVGELDTLVDVVGSVAGLDALGVERVHVSPLPLGGGTVETAHGRLPVPAPATAELLRGFPVYDNGVAAELVTPTGAAILTTLGTPGRLPPMTLERIGWGAGTKELPIPNLLRVLVGQGTDASATPTPTSRPWSRWRRPSTTCRRSSTSRSSSGSSPAGALDVYLTPVVMKRSRPGTVLTALAPPELAERLAEALFRETTTIGVRWSEVKRRRLPRELVRLPTTVGPVTFKISRLGGRVVTVTPEFEEVRRIADAQGRPVREVLEAVRREGTPGDRRRARVPATSDRAARPGRARGGDDG